MPTNLPDDVREQIETELLAGRKISAIKAYRTATGADLTHAKGAVDAMETELRAKSPGRFELTPRGGCLGMLIVIAGPIGLIVWMLARG